MIRGWSLPSGSMSLGRGGTKLRGIGVVSSVCRGLLHPHVPFRPRPQGLPGITPGIESMLWLKIMVGSTVANPPGQV